MLKEVFRARQSPGKVCIVVYLQFQYCESCLAISGLAKCLHLSFGYEANEIT